MEKEIIAHIRFDRELYDKIKAKAKANGLTVSGFIRMVVIRELTH